MTAPRPAATGSIAVPGRKRAPTRSAAIPHDPSGLGIHPELGLVMAGESPRPVQPRFLRSGRQAVGSHAQTGLVERSAAASGSGNDVPDFKADSQPQGPHGPVHHESGRRRPLVRAAGRNGRWAVPRALRAGGKPDGQPAASQAVQQPGGEEVQDATWTSTARPSKASTIVCTTYRLTEHYHYWTKNNPMNMQLVPEPFVEIPEELADETGDQGWRQGQGLPAHAGTTTIRQGHGHQAHQADDDRRARENLSDRHSHSLGLSRASATDGRKTERDAVRTCFRPR